MQTDALAKHRTALIKGASKLTMEQSLTVITSHQVQICLRNQRPPVCDGGQLIKYWAILTDMPEIILKTCQTLNLVTCMSEPDYCTSFSIEQKCSKVIDLAYSIWPDLRCPC